jgi:hypothetical protein
MFDRIVMDIIQMLPEIILIPNNMIPKAILPNSALSKLLSKLSHISDLESVDDSRNRLAAIVDEYVEMVGKDNPGLRFFIYPAPPEKIYVQ